MAIFRFKLILPDKIRTFEMQGTEQFLFALHSFWVECKYYEGSSYSGIIIYDDAFKDRLYKFVSQWEGENKKVYRIDSFFKKVHESERFALVTYDDTLPDNKTINVYTNLLKLRCHQLGKKYEEIHLPFMRGEGMAMIKYDSYYFDDLEEGEIRIGEKDSNKRICRFCKKSKPEVSFRKEAHAIPEALGNTKFFCLEECGDCNYNLSKIEDNLSRFMEFRRAYYGVPTKKGKIPEVEGSNFVIRRDATGKANIYIDASKFKREDLLQDNSKIRLYNKQVVNNEGIYKALVKCVVDLLPMSEIPYFINTIEWINGTLFDESLPSVYLAYHSSKIYIQPQCKIFINSQKHLYSPYCTALFYTCDMVYMFMVPFVTIDKGRFKYDDDLMEHWRNFFRYFPYNWQPWDLSDDTPAHPHYDFTIGKVDKMLNGPIDKGVFKSKRLIQNRKKKVNVDFPEPNVDDIKSVNIRNPKILMDTKLELTEEMKRDVSVNFNNPRIVLDKKASLCIVVLDLDIKDSTNMVDYMKCSYAVEIVLNDFSKNIELTETSLAFDYRLRDVLWQTACVVGEMFFYPQRHGTTFESFCLNDLATLKNIVRNIEYHVVDTNGKTVMIVQDRNIHND